MDVVLGVAFGSSAPATIHTVLICGANGDGIVLEERTIDVPPDSEPDSADFPAVDAAIAAILQVRDAAGTAGNHLVLTGVTVTDPIAADALASKLAATGLENVALISPSLAAASLGFKMGRATSRDSRGLLSVDSVGDRLDTAETCADGLLPVCSGGDAATTLPRLEPSAGQAVSAPPDPEAVLAHGAALAIAGLAEAAEASTAALAYTQEAEFGPIAPGYYDIPDIRDYPSGFGADGLAYSAVPDEQADADTEVFSPQPVRRPLLVAGAGLASTAFAAASALMISMTLDVTPNLVALRPDIVRALTIPYWPPNLQIPASQPFSGQPPVRDRGPVNPLPPPPLNRPTPPNLPQPAPMNRPKPADLPVAAPLAPESVATPGSAPVAFFNPPLLGLPPGMQFRAVYISGTYSSDGPPRLMMTEISDASMQWSPPRQISPVVEPAPPNVMPEPPMVNHQLPIELPAPPVVEPAPPNVMPEPPVVDPQPPVALPAPPVVEPNPGIHLPDLPAKVPDAPGANPHP